MYIGYWKSKNIGKNKRKLERVENYKRRLIGWLMYSIGMVIGNV